MDGITESLIVSPMPLSDLSSALSATIATPQVFTKGTVVSWDSTTRRGSIRISGVVFVDLSALDTAALSTIVENDTVLILKLDQSWLIVGRILDPL